MQTWNGAVAEGIAAWQVMALVSLVALTAGDPGRASAADKQKSVKAVYSYTARTVGQVLKIGAVKAAGIEWTCRDKTCTARGPWPAPNVQACQALARQTGRIAEYGHAGAKLDAADLDRCNQSLPPAMDPAAKTKNPVLAGAAPAARTAKLEHAQKPRQSAVPSTSRDSSLIVTKGTSENESEAVKPLLRVKAPPRPQPGEDAVGPTVATGASRVNPQDQEENWFLDYPWALAGIVAAAIAIPMMEDRLCDPVSVTEAGIAPSDATGAAGGTHVITWKTDPLQNDCDHWGIVVFCEVPGQSSLLPDGIVIRQGDTTSVQFDRTTDTYSLSWTRPARFPPDCVLSVYVGAGHVEMP